MLHFHPGDAEPSAVSSALAGAAPEVPRLMHHAPGLAHAGEHVASIEFELGDDTAGDRATIARAAEIAATIADSIDAARSVALIGTDVDFVPCEPQPIRFAYFMRRRHDFTHDQYLARYHDVHAQFGIDTPGIEGYTQFHVDLEASAAAAAAIGFGVCDIDSVSELHLTSLDTFFKALVAAGFGTEATEDEARFVDRANSWDYVYERSGGDSDNSSAG